MEQLARLQSGIEGLDTLLEGGFVAGASYIVQGRPGSGKTILANQIAFHHAKGGGRVLFATLLSESHERLFQFLSTMTFFDRERVGDELQFVSAFDTLESEGLDEVVKLLRREIVRQKASLLVVDGLLNARSRAESPLDTKKFIAELQGHAAFAGCTVLFLTSSRLDDGSPEHTMVDGVIELGEELIGSRSIRRLNLRKTRGSSAVAGQHEFQITGRGIVVHPRLEAVLGRPANADSFGTSQIPSGVADLDDMIGGGLQRTSVTLVIGPSGSGKTTLGLNFLAQSTPEEPGLHFGFYETEERLKRKAEALGLDLRGKIGSGAVRVQWQPTTELWLDAMGHQLLRQVREGKIRRVLIDSLGGMARASTNPGRHVEFFTALINELRALGATVMATWEIRDMLGTNAHAPAMELSSLFDNLFLLRFVEAEAELRRFLSVIKIRDSQYDPSVRELVITSRGIHLTRAVKNMATVATTTFTHPSGS
ncbi:MAG: putative circadian clock protein KaiC [Roseomonas sp.]|nr:putative circadian clock protein KaiC [Roseomonas sp.]